jgi:DNA replicative helicase MCM subunit Mcm2 (Cdc46/Mcm family)
MPRHITLSCDRYLVDTVKPGTRVCCIGIYTTYEAKKTTNREVNSCHRGAFGLRYN